MHVVSAPLQWYFAAFTDKVGDEIYLVFGPQVNDPSPSSFYHEALHHVLSPSTERLDGTATSRKRLKEYEAGTMTLAQFFPRIIANIDVGREKHRWHDLTKNVK